MARSDDETRCELLFFVLRAKPETPSSFIDDYFYIERDRAIIDTLCDPGLGLLLIFDPLS